MVDDIGASQARLLLDALYEEVARISHRLESIELRGLRTSARGALFDRREQSGLRRDLYEAHRLIDGLHRRFPATDTRPARLAVRDVGRRTSIGRTPLAHG
jgi:hypothetical protein